MINLEELIIKLNNTISRNIELSDFCRWYEDWFSKVQDEKLSQAIFSQLENLYTDIGFYEPNEALRAEHSSYFGDDNLLILLRGTLEIINNN